MADQPEMLAAWGRDGLIAAQKPAVAKLGGAGLGLVALLSAERVLPGLVSLDTLRRLGGFVLYMQKPDGGFYSKFMPESGGRNDDWTSLYYPGEAALGLVMLYESDPDRRWLAGALGFLTYLARQRRGEAQVEPDQWALLATARLLPHLGSERDDDRDLLRGHALQICERMLLDRTIALALTERPGCFTSDGRTCPTATRLEGLLATLTMVGPEERALREELTAAVAEGINFLLRAQVQSGPLAGAIPQGIASDRNRKHERVRIDYVQHALSAMLQYEALFLPARRLTRAALDEALALGRRYFLRHQRSEGTLRLLLRLAPPVRRRRGPSGSPGGICLGLGPDPPGPAGR